MFVQSRTHNCGELRIVDSGKNVTLVGFYEGLRQVGTKLAFLSLRDFYGVTQVVVEKSDVIHKIRSINKESTIKVEGVVRERKAANTSIPTGEIEVLVEQIEVLGKCYPDSLPFEINKSRESDEQLRLKYRFLDLRNPLMKNNLLIRSKFIMKIREKMHDLGFLEVTTPILTASSPEGARDYLVPSRKHRGKFYALPQAPQQFKQILMSSGIDKYFQIAPCFRDEDSRSDRSPGEFYQLDMEMAFASQEDVFEIIENILPDLFKEFGQYEIAMDAPFPRIPYQEAMELYGSDKPDLRINLQIQDFKYLSTIDIPIFHEFDCIKGLVVEGYSPSRKEIESLINENTKDDGATKIFWFKVDEAGKVHGGISKLLKQYESQVSKELSLIPNSIVFIVAGKNGKVQQISGGLRKELGMRVPHLFNEESYNFCWIIDFPMYELDEETGKLIFSHNPFSMPQCSEEELDEKDPLTIKAYQYDLVCNGVELSSGAVRNHDPKMMEKIFEKVGLSKEDITQNYSAVYNALCFGAPPHAGIAPGIDRMLMLLLDEENIREVVAFPMNAKAQDILMGAPSEVPHEQLNDLGIEIPS